MGLQSESSCLWLPIFPLGLVVLKAHAGGNLCRSLMLTHIFRWLSATAAPAAARQFAHMWVCFSFHLFFFWCFVSRTRNEPLQSLLKDKLKKKKNAREPRIHSPRPWWKPPKGRRASNGSFRAPPSAPTEARSASSEWKSLKMAPVLNYHGNALVCAGDRATGEQVTNSEISLGQRIEGGGDGGIEGGERWLAVSEKVISVSLPVFPVRIRWFITRSSMPSFFFFFSFLQYATPPKNKINLNFMSLWIPLDYHWLTFFYIHATFKQYCPFSQKTAGKLQRNTLKPPR